MNNTRLIVGIAILIVCAVVTAFLAGLWLAEPEQARLPVEFIDGAPVSAQFPGMVEVCIADTAPPAHAHEDSTWKAARLDNGIEIMVPQFIKNGDIVRLDMQTLKYAERVKSAGK